MHRPADPSLDAPPHSHPIFSGRNSPSAICLRCNLRMNEGFWTDVVGHLSSIFEGHVVNKGRG
jgi:hypothetical protein